MKSFIVTVGVVISFFVICITISFIFDILRKYFGEVAYLIMLCGIIFGALWWCIDIVLKKSA